MYIFYLKTESYETEQQKKKKTFNDKNAIYEKLRDQTITNFPPHVS